MNKRNPSKATSIQLLQDSIETYRDARRYFAKHAEQAQSQQVANALHITVEQCDMTIYSLKQLLSTLEKRAGCSKLTYEIRTEIK